MASKKSAAKAKKPAATSRAAVRAKSASKSSKPAGKVKTAAKSQAQSRPKSRAKPAAKSRAKSSVKTRAKSLAKPSSTSPVKSSPRRSKKIEPPKVKPLFGISTDKGVLVSVSTTVDAPLLSNFALAAKDPFPRRVTAPRAKGRLASTVIRDETTQTDVRVYLAFLPVPAGFPVVGQLLYGAISHPGDDVFFNVSTEFVSKIEGKQLARMLMILEAPFGEILPAVFGKDHSLSVVFMDLAEKKRALEFWKATQDKVESLLKANQGKEALAVLEPLVYQKTPHVQAEKLLGDILWRSYVKDKPDQAASDISRQVSTERLLFQYLLKVIGLSSSPTS